MRRPKDPITRAEALTRWRNLRERARALAEGLENLSEDMYGAWRSWPKERQESDEGAAWISEAERAEGLAMFTRDTEGELKGNEP